ncbi:GNAT family N-acetyltransferase [Acidisphaera sp. L21]|uniref:GNAT family N-acetyltransferase n=1 Tax=Acidisphaera sp. L21 TaxID=1641851 RepID=UPI00131AB2FC|nr:GNAT family N-acetyltransferase [Acidisphaera sp. L21]
MSPDNAIQIQTFTGHAIAEAQAAFQLLHVNVFEDWPYLYRGDPTERPYIAGYINHPRAALFLASHAGQPVGAATCLPLEDESANVRAPFEARGWDLRRFFYFGEGVVRSEWRGKGLGVRFFELRESHARATSSADYTLFCSVRRPADHPLRPSNAHTNDAFWRNRGYVPLPGVACTMTWKDVGDAAESKHTLDFWIKSLTGAPLPCG